MDALVVLVEASDLLNSSVLRINVPDESGAIIAAVVVAVGPVAANRLIASTQSNLSNGTLHPMSRN